MSLIIEGPCTNCRKVLTVECEDNPYKIEDGLAYHTVINGFYCGCGLYTSWGRVAVMELPSILIELSNEEVET